MLVAALPTVCGCAGGDPNGSDINTPAHVSGQGITCSLPGGDRSPLSRRSLKNRSQRNIAGQGMRKGATAISTFEEILSMVFFMVLAFARKICH